MRRSIALGFATILLVAALPARAAGSPQHAHSLQQEAFSLQHQHRWQQAEQAFRHSVATEPNATDYAALANFLDLTGRPAEGLTIARKGRALFPEDPALAVSYAECLGDTDHYHQAMALCQRELRTVGKGDRKLRARFYLILAGAQGEAAQKDGLFAMLKYAFAVKTNIDKSVALDPSYARAQYGAGEYDCEAPIGANVKKGIALLQVANRLDPDDYGILLELIHQLGRAGHKAQARTELARFEQDFSALPAARHDIAPIAAKLR